MQIKEKPYTEHRMKVDGLNIHYTDWGNPHLPHLFLAHGAVANAVYWDLVAPAFHDQYHIVAVTARGRSKSDYAPDGKYGTEDYVQDFRELTLGLGLDKIIYVGQSMGGKIGMTYADMYPEQVERMILVDIGGESTGAPAGDPMKSRPEVFNSRAEMETWLRQFDRFPRLNREALDIVLQTSFQQPVNEQWVSSLANPPVYQQRPVPAAGVRHTGRNPVSHAPDTLLVERPDGPRDSSQNPGRDSQLRADSNRFRTSAASGMPRGIYPGSQGVPGGLKPSH